MKKPKKERIEERKKISKARRRREKETARKAGMKVLRGEKRET